MTGLLVFLAAMFLHELGHVSAALVFDVKVYRISWDRWGMFSAMDMPKSRFVFCFVTLAGPITSAAFFLLGCVDGWYGFALANMLIIFASALPGGDFWRLFEYRSLRIRARLTEVCR